jgi:hypothetical protein
MQVQVAVQKMPNLMFFSIAGQHNFGLLAQVYDDQSLLVDNHLQKRT